MHTPRRSAPPARRTSLALAAALAGTLVVALPADAATFPGPGPIAIPDGTTANPYPSATTVGGLTGVVTGVDVTLTGLTHTYPGDLGVLLTGPDGQAVLLMGHVGGGADVAGVTVTFSATATATIPANGPLVSGVYLPSADAAQPLSFPAPAPAGAGTDLGVFAGTDPAGTWSLYVLDGWASDAGSLGGWALDIETAPVAHAGGPYTVAEGAPLALDASAGFAWPGATYAWDLDADGAYDDATGRAASVAPATLAALGLGEGPLGPLTVGLQVTDGATVTTASTTLSVVNAAPTATVTLPRQILAGTAFTMKVGAIDPSPADAAGTFTYEIDWTGDGVVDQALTGPADPPVSHTYETAGTYRVSVWATDRDGARSAPQVTDVVVVPALAASGGVPGTAWLAAAALALGGLLLAAGRRLRRSDLSTP